MGLQADKVLRDTCTDSHNQLSEKCVIPAHPDVMTNQIPIQKRITQGRHCRSDFLCMQILKWQPQVNLPDRFLVSLSHLADSSGPF